MTRRLTALLNAATLRVLPSSRREWGEAMSAELAYIDDRAALVHAGNCVLAAVGERVRDFETRFSAAVGLVAMATVVFALDQLGCAMRGVQVLLGRSDGMLALLVSRGAGPELVARYQTTRPLVVTCLVALGAIHLLGAWLLLRRRWRPFLAVWSAALAVAVCAVWLQLRVVWSLDGVPSEVNGVLVQAVSLSLILAWVDGRRPRFRGLS
jgi:hypothetical protein